MQERGILYAPDFVINAGGLIYVAAFYDRANVKESITQVGHIYGTLLEIFARAKKENRGTNEVAEMIAMEKLK